MTRSQAAAVGPRRRPHRRTCDAHPACAQSARRVAPVVAVVALARDHDHAPAVRAAEHRERPQRDGVAGATDQHVDRFGRGRVDRRHLLGSDDGQHGSVGHDDGDGHEVGVA